MSEAQAWINAYAKRQKGEFVLILAASTEAPQSDWQSLVKLLLAEKVSTKSIAKVVAKYTGENKKAVYQYILSLVNE